MRLDEAEVGERLAQEGQGVADGGGKVRVVEEELGVRDGDAVREGRANEGGVDKRRNAVGRQGEFCASGKTGGLTR